MLKITYKFHRNESNWFAHRSFIGLVTSVAYIMNALLGISVLEEPYCPIVLRITPKLVTDICGLIAFMRCQNLDLAGWSDLFKISNLL
jgi:hypothetical protein